MLPPCQVQKCLTRHMMTASRRNSVQVEKEGVGLAAGMGVLPDPLSRLMGDPSQDTTVVQEPAQTPSPLLGAVHWLSGCLGCHVTATSVINDKPRMAGIH